MTRQRRRRHARARISFVRVFARAAVGFTLAAILIWVAGEIVRSPAVDRAAAANNRWIEWERRLYGQMDEVDLQRIEQAAKARLAAQPLDHRAIRLVALVAASRGEMARAEGLMELAIERAPGDVDAHAWLFDQKFALGDIVSALPHLNAILRVQPQAVAQALPAIYAIAAADGGVAAIVSLLSADPPWRRALLAQLIRNAPDAGRTTLEIFQAMITAGLQPPNEEITPFLDRLVRDERYEEAFALWRRWRGRHETRRSRQYIFDGAFAVDPTGAPFEWQLARGAGFRTGFEAASGESDRALKLEFTGARVRFQHVNQLLMLPAGQYRLTGRFKTDDFATPRGLRWSVACAGQDGRTLAASDLLREADDWRSFNFSFERPPENCAAQWLTLAIAARIPSEFEISGRIWFDDLEIAETRQEALFD